MMILVSFRQMCVDRLFFIWRVLWRRYNVTGRIKISCPWLSGFAFRMSWLRALGAQKGFRLVSYQQIWVTLPTGTKIQIRSPFFVKASPKRGRKKRGPQNRGQHLFLSLMGFVHKVEPGLAFRAAKLAVLTPSFDIASKILAQEGIKLSPNKT